MPGNRNSCFQLFSPLTTPSQLHKKRRKSEKRGHHENVDVLAADGKAPGSLPKAESRGGCSGHGAFQGVSLFPLALPGATACSACGQDDVVKMLTPESPSGLGGGGPRATVSREQSSVWLRNDSVHFMTEGRADSAGRLETRQEREAGSWLSPS